MERATGHQGESAVKPAAASPDPFSVTSKMWRCRKVSVSGLPTCPPGPSSERPWRCEAASSHTHTHTRLSHAGRPGRACCTHARLRAPLCPLPGQLHLSPLCPQCLGVGAGGPQLPGPGRTVSGPPVQGRNVSHREKGGSTASGFRKGRREGSRALWAGVSG